MNYKMTPYYPRGKHLMTVSRKKAETSKQTLAPDGQTLSAMTGLVGYWFLKNSTTYKFVLCVFESLWKLPVILTSMTTERKPCENIHADCSNVRPLIGTSGLTPSLLWNRKKTFQVHKKTIANLNFSFIHFVLSLLCVLLVSWLMVCFLTLSISACH